MYGEMYNAYKILKERNFLEYLLSFRRIILKRILRE